MLPLRIYIYIYICADASLCGKRRKDDCECESLRVSVDIRQAMLGCKLILSLHSCLDPALGTWIYIYIER